jgi:hypothetical protein
MARRAADACFRGVVADASLVSEVIDVSESAVSVAEAS